MRARIAKKKFRKLTALFDLSTFPGWIEIYQNSVFILALNQALPKGHWNKCHIPCSKETMDFRQWGSQTWYELWDAYLSRKLGGFKTLWRVAQHELRGSGTRHKSRLLWVTTPNAARPTPVCIIQHSMGIHDIVRVLGKAPAQISGLYRNRRDDVWGLMHTLDYNRPVRDGDLLVLDSLPETMPKTISIWDAQRVSLKS